MISERLERLATAFWDDAGGTGAFPRDLEDVLTDTKPINVVALRGLSVAAVRRNLAHLPHTFGLAVRHRPLHGCLVAYHGGASLYVEESLPAPERRVIVAHEAAHFLNDYEQRRQRATRRVGPQLLSIFDGLRAPTPTEKLEATLSGVELTAHVHFMERGTYSAPTSRSEQDADDLGLELLAPWRDVTAALKARGPLPKAWEPWCEMLETRYGLPASWAQPYAARLLAHSRARRSFSETLGL